MPGSKKPFAKRISRLMVPSVARVLVVLMTVP